MTNPNDDGGVTQAVGCDRRLGSFDAAMVVVGAVIGGGIFLAPARSRSSKDVCSVMLPHTENSESRVNRRETAG